MDIRAIKQFSSPICGNVSQGQLIDVPDAFGRQLIDWGMGEQVHVVKKSLPTDGSVKQSQSSPAVQVSPKSNVITSESLAGRQSQSTPATSSLPGQTLSTDVTEPGGTKTSNTSQKKRRNGRKTKTPT